MLIKTRNQKMNPVVFMFSGQGSQYYSMGQQLYQENALFKYWLDQCNEITFPLLRRSLVDIIYNPKDKYVPFDELVYSNPALLSIQFCISQVLKKSGIKPDYCLGYSIGELAAAVVSEALSLEDALHFLIDYSIIVENNTPQSAMLAILESESSIDIGNCWITARNLPNHFVISGLVDDVSRIKLTLDRKGVVSQILPVNIGFHTKLINQVESQVKSAFSKIEIRPSCSRMVSCYHQDVIERFDSNHFWNAVRHPVEFRTTLSNLLLKDDYTFIDVGPSGTLSTFVKYTLEENTTSMALEVMNHFGNNLQTLSKVLTEFNRD